MISLLSQGDNSSSTLKTAYLLDGRNNPMNIHKCQVCGAEATQGSFCNKDFESVQTILKSKKNVDKKLQVLVLSKGTIIYK